MNSLTKNNPYPLFSIDEILDLEVNKEFCSFLDGFSGYN
jgi:hypothetical protein